MVIKRKIYDELVQTMNKKRIPLLIGLRRVGKTTLLKQLEGDFPNSKYVSFDKFKINSSSPSETYNSLFRIESSQRIVYCKENAQKNGIEFRSIYELNKLS